MSRGQLAGRVTIRLRLLRGLGAARRPTLGALCAMEALRALLPAVAAYATGRLVTGLGAGDRVSTALAALGTALVVNQLVGALLDPVRGLVTSQIDGEHRRRVAQLVLADEGLARLEDTHIQDLIRRCAADPTNWTEKTPGDGATGQLTACFRALGLVSSVLVIADYAWWLAPAAVVPALIVRALTQYQWIGINRTWAAGITDSRRSDYWAGLTTSPAEAREMRVFGFGDWVVRRQQHHRLAHFKPAWRMSQEAVNRQWIQFLVTAVPLAAIFTLAGLRGLQHPSELGLLTAALAATWGAFSATAGNNDAFAVAGAVPVVAAFRELAATLPSADLPSISASLTSARPPAIRFEGVTFRYPRATRSALRGLDLDIRPGEVLAIVGLNGAGKSTLIKLLAGLYAPDTGRITADGQDIHGRGLAAWRQQLAVVFQDFVRYRFTARDNIALGSAAHLDDQTALQRAVFDAGLAGLLEKLPNGLDTPLTRTCDGGVDLSGGQWQQVALARALFAVHTGARVLVLDEPTAHLDVRTEFELFHRLIKVARRVTVVLISHRLSTVREADRIALIDDGRVVESGSHDELIALGGRYATMFEIQARRFQSPAGEAA